VLPNDHGYLSIAAYALLLFLLSHCCAANLSLSSVARLAFQPEPAECSERRSPL
jgi:hypothetical protein